MKLNISPATIRRVAERKILEAIEAGQLDGMPGLGKPIPGIDDPYDPLWWVNSWKERVQVEHGLPLGRPAARSAS